MASFQLVTAYAVLTSVTAHHLDMEFHTALGNPQSGSPSPEQQCSFRASQ